MVLYIDDPAIEVCKKCEKTCTNACRINAYLSRITTEDICSNCDSEANVLEAQGLERNDDCDNCEMSKYSHEEGSWIIMQNPARKPKHTSVERHYKAAIVDWVLDMEIEIEPVYECVMDMMEKLERKKEQEEKMRNFTFKK